MWDIFMIKMGKSFQGFVKMPPQVGMHGSCPCPVREELDPELFNTFEDRSWEQILLLYFLRILLSLFQRIYLKKTELSVSALWLCLTLFLRSDLSGKEV